MEYVKAVGYFDFIDKKRMMCDRYSPQAEAYMDHDLFLYILHDEAGSSPELARIVHEVKIPKRMHAGYIAFRDRAQEEVRKNGNAAMSFVHGLLVVFLYELNRYTPLSDEQKVAVEESWGIYRTRSTGELTMKK